MSNKALKILNTLNFRKIDNIENELVKSFGLNKASDIVKKWNQLSKLADESDNPGRQDALYEYLNSDFELSMMVASYTDGEIIKTFGNWLYDNRHAFGKNILDVGCGTGILSCCLAEILPEAHITAIDRSGNCISIAKQIQKKAGISNIEFVTANAEAISKEFDTVLSLRTFHENIGIRYTSNMFLPFSQQIETYEDIYSRYINTLSKLVIDGGNLICIERNHMDTEFYALLRTLKKEKLNVKADSLLSLSCNESDFNEKSEFQTFIADKNNALAAKEDIFAIWSEKAFSESTDPDDFTRAQVDWFTENNSAGVMEGYTTSDKKGTQLAKACLYKDINSADGFLMYQANIREAGVQVLPFEALEEAREILSDHKLIDQAMGFVVKDIE